MASIHHDILDAALSYIETYTETLYITNAEAASYAEASSTYALGNKSGPAFTGPAAGDVSGRKLTIDAITDGSVTATDTATHWALTDNSESKLLVTGALASSQAVTSGNTFSLTATDIEVPDPA